MFKGEIKQQLERYGFNTRERANAYVGGVMGALAPIAFFKYMISPRVEDSLGREALAWGISAVINVGSTLAIPGFPLGYTIGVGYVTGLMGAKNLRDKRMRREEKDIGLTTIVEDINASKITQRKGD